MSAYWHICTDCAGLIACEEFALITRFSGWKSCCDSCGKSITPGEDYFGIHYLHARLTQAEILRLFDYARTTLAARREVQHQSDVSLPSV